MSGQGGPAHHIELGRQAVEIVGDRFLLTPKARLNYFPHIGCIFIHIPKTAGTSVSAALAQIDEYLRLDGQPAKFELPLRKHNRHAKALTYRDRLERDIWDKAFTFCVVRNPFEQMVSCYHWWLQLAPKFPHLRETSQRVAALGGFNAFLRDDLGARRINEFIGEPEHWFQDAEGRDMVDFIVRNEEIDTLLARLGEYVKVPKGVRIERRNATRRGHYAAYYDDACVAAVAQRFRYCIERFGYRFEPA